MLSIVLLSFCAFGHLSCFSCVLTSRYRILEGCSVGFAPYLMFVNCEAHYMIDEGAIFTVCQKERSCLAL